MRIELPIIETERLVLREISEYDYVDMYEYAHLDYIGPVAGWEPHTDFKYTKDVINAYRKKKFMGQLGVFAVILKSENKMIGTCELHSFIPGFKAELGYTINPNYWGKGYATEAGYAMTEWGFTVLNLKRIECCCFTSNVMSKKVCEKLKYTYEGIRRKAYQLYNGKIYDLVCYSMTDDEFMEKYIK